MSLARARTLGVTGSLLQAAVSVLNALILFAPLARFSLPNPFDVSGLLSLLTGIGLLLSMYAIENISKHVGDRSIIDGIVIGIAFYGLSFAFYPGNYSLLGAFSGFLGGNLLSLRLLGALKYLAYLLLYVVGVVFATRSFLSIARKLQLRFFRIAGLAGLIAALSSAIVRGLLFLVAYPLVAIAFLSLATDKAGVQSRDAELVLKVKERSGQLRFSDNGILEIKKVKVPFLSKVTTAAFTSVTLTYFILIPLGFILPSYSAGRQILGIVGPAIVFAALVFVVWMSRRRFPTLSSENVGEKRTMIPWESVSIMNLKKKEFSMETAYGTFQARLSPSTADEIAAMARWKLREKLVVER